MASAVSRSLHSPRVLIALGMIFCIAVLRGVCRLDRAARSRRPEPAGDPAAPGLGRRRRPELSVGHRQPRPLRAVAADLWRAHRDAGGAVRVARRHDHRHRPGAHFRLFRRRRGLADRPPGRCLDVVSAGDLVVDPDGRARRRLEQGHPRHRAGGLDAVLPRAAQRSADRDPARLCRRRAAPRVFPLADHRPRGAAGDDAALDHAHQPGNGDRGRGRGDPVLHRPRRRRQHAGLGPDDRRRAAIRLSVAVESAAADSCDFPRPSPRSICSATGCAARWTCGLRKPGADHAGAASQRPRGRRPHRRRNGAGDPGVVVRPAAGKNSWARGRVRRRQIHGRPRHCAAAAGWFRNHVRVAAVRRRGPRAHGAGRAARIARPRHRLHPAGADDLAQSGAHHRRAIRRAFGAARRRQPRRAPRPRGRHAGGGAVAARRRIADAISASIVRRHVPARADRLGVFQPIRAWSSPTSRPPRSTSPCIRRSSR